MSSASTQDYVSEEGTLQHKIAVLVLVVSPLVGLVYALYTLWGDRATWLDVALLIGGWQLTGLGVTIGFHRMLTHDGFKAKWYVKAFFLALGSMAFEGAAAIWKAIHTIHHKYSDKEGDPHSPLQGFWYAHMWWLFTGPTPAERRYARTFMSKDPMLAFFSKTFPLWCVVSLVVPFLIGGISGYWGNTHAWSWGSAWQAFVWGGLVRVGLTNHATWSVNSVCHTWGSRMFITSDRSMNNWIVALFSAGEGWHHNHHRFPRSPRHGLAWYQFDPSWIVIWCMSKVGLVWGLEETLPNWRSEVLS